MGSIALEHEQKGPYLETVCKLVDQGSVKELPEAAVEAISSAVGVVQMHDSASQISEWSHEISRSWNNTPNGAELDIYSDLVPDDVYYERKLKLDELNEVYDDLFK